MIAWNQSLTLCRHQKQNTWPQALFTAGLYTRSRQVGQRQSSGSSMVGPKQAQGAADKCRGIWVPHKVLGACMLAHDRRRACVEEAERPLRIIGAPATGRQQQRAVPGAIQQSSSPFFVQIETCGEYLMEGELIACEDHLGFPCQPRADGSKDL